MWGLSARTLRSRNAASLAGSSTRSEASIFGAMVTPFSG